MKYRSENLNGVTLLHLQGDLGKPEAEQLRQILDTFMSNGQHRFVLDMEEVSFIDSQAILLLLRMNREAIGGGGEIKLLRPRQAVKRFLDIGKVLELFERHESKIEAVKSFAPETVRPPLRPVNHLVQTGLCQKLVILRLVEILIRKGYLRMDEFHQEMNRSSQAVFDLFRKQLNHP